MRWPLARPSRPSTAQRRIAIFLDLFVNATLGSLFALLARDRLRVDGAFAMPVVALVLMFLGMIRLPMMLYLYVVHPAWSWHYLVAPEDLPELALLAAVSVQCALLMGAWWLGAYLWRAGKRLAVPVILAAGGLGVVVTAVVLAPRLGVYGTYEAYAEGRVLDLFAVKLGYVIIALTLGLGAAAAFVCVELVRDSRRVRAL